MSSSSLLRKSHIALGRLTGKMTMQYEPAAKPNARVLTSEEKTTLQEGLKLSEGEDMGDIYVAIVRAGEILAKWRDGIEKAVSEGETVLEISKARLPTPSTPAQVLALHAVDLVEVDVTRIELPEEKSKEERAVEITENILENTVIAEPVQITYLHASSSDEAGGESSNTDDGDFDEMKGSAMKTELSSLPSDNKWSVTIRDGGQGKNFVVKESELLGPNFVIQQTYNNLSAEQRQRMLAKGKRKRQAEFRKKETELAELARKKKRDGEQREYENLLLIIRSGRAYAYEEFSGLLDRVRKPFTIKLENRDVTVTECDAAIMLEESAVKKIGDMLVRKKKGNDDDDMEQPTRKRRRHNEACNTTRGATIAGAMRGTCRRDQQETAASKKKQVTSLNAEKKSNSIVLTLVSKRKEQCEEACMNRSRQQQEARPPLPSSGDGAVEGVADPQEMIVDEYWEVNENSVKDVMGIFLRLFVPESKVLLKNKPIKWCLIKEKALLVTKAHFDSKVEATMQRTLQVEALLARLQTEDNPAGVLEDADDDTSDDKNRIETSLID
jgi:hypothetical protein